MAKEDNLKSYTKGDPRAVVNGAKGGKNKKGSKHISTWIQEMLTDPKSDLKLKDGTLLNEVPLIAIIKTAMAKSISGDNRWAEWLAKHGYGEKLNLEVTDTRKDILERYGLPHAGQAQETESRPPSNSA